MTIVKSLKGKHEMINLGLKNKAPAPTLVAFNTQNIKREVNNRNNLAVYDNGKIYVWVKK